MTVARVHVRSWQVGYRGLLDDAYLNSLRHEYRARRYTFGAPWPGNPLTLVAEIDNRNCGFATVAAAKGDEGGPLAEVNALYVDPDYWRQGVGALLESAASGTLYQFGFCRAVLWIMAGNSSAMEFYRSRGWSVDGTRREAVVWGAVVEEIRMGRNLEVRSIDL